MSKFILFALFFWFLRNPFLALILLLFVYLIVDKAYLGFIPDPFRAFRVSSRKRELIRTIEINPQDGRALKELGIILLERGHPGDALGYFKMAGEKMSDDLEFLYYYGLSLARTGDVDGGRKLIEQALADDPRLKYGEPYLMLAEVYIDKGDNESALPLLEKFTGIHTSSSRGFYQLGHVLLALGRRDEARESLKKSVKVFKDSPRYKRKIDRKWAWKSRLLAKKII